VAHVLPGQLEHAKIQSLIVGAGPVLTRGGIDHNRRVNMIEQFFAECMQVAPKEFLVLSVRIAANYALGDGHAKVVATVVDVPEGIVSHPDVGVMKHAVEIPYNAAVG
jgi:hypothetical protein